MEGVDSDATPPNHHDCDNICEQEDNEDYTPPGKPNDSGTTDNSPASVVLPIENAPQEEDKAAPMAKDVLGTKSG